MWNRRNADCHVTNKASYLRSTSRSCFCCCLVTKMCPSLWDPVEYSLQGSSVHGISQERTLEWIAIPFSRESSQPKDWTGISCIGRRILYHWATWYLSDVRVSCTAVLMDQPLWWQQDWRQQNYMSEENGHIKYGMYIRCTMTCH